MYVIYLHWFFKLIEVYVYLIKIVFIFSWNIKLKTIDWQYYKHFQETLKIGEN